MNLIELREIERVRMMRRSDRNGIHPRPINEFVKKLIYEIAETIHILYLHMHYIIEFSI